MSVLWLLLLLLIVRREASVGCDAALRFRERRAGAVDKGRAPCPAFTWNNSLAPLQSADRTAATSHEVQQQGDQGQGGCSQLDRGELPEEGVHQVHPQPQGGEPMLLWPDTNLPLRQGHRCRGSDYRSGGRAVDSGQAYASVAYQCLWNY